MRLLSLLSILSLAGCATVSTAVPAAHAEVGVAFDRNGDIVSFADGIADPQSGRRVTIDDPVRVASVSKMVTAIGVMKLVDDGRLDLSSDVSRWLGWSLRNPNFPGRPITLSMLLAHTSSVREHDDDYVIPLGETLRQALSDPRNWDSQHGPGDNVFAYVNFNYPIIGSIIEKVTGERFDIWMRRAILDPMKLDACFNWPTCSDAAVARAVELDEPGGKPVKDDLHGRRPDCPVFVKEGASCDLKLWRLGENGALFAPQGGLRISARGLARIGRMLLNGGALGGVRLLSPRAVELLLAQTWRFDGTNGATEGGFYCSAGNGTHRIPNKVPGCGDDMGTRGAVLVGHAGDAYGMKGGLWLDRSRGRGVAYFVTGVADPAPKAADSAYSAAEEQAFRRTYALLPAPTTTAKR
ncbi:serine hydrolase domain-containing protein [Sphingomonas sp.]|uniref:serine hydrolase domain-containing protein n=1 Tax=Sphingomonas sp. TaxID=28214 RepID=UPI0038A4DADD